MGAAAAAAARPVAADNQPASRLPTADVAARPKPVATVDRRVAQPGDRICANCGEANDPGRKFCRRCGNSLVEAKVVAAVSIPWWRRIFRREPKPAKQMAAGDRVSSMQAGARGGLRGVMKLRTIAVGALAIFVAIGIFGYVGVPGFQKFVNEATSGGVPGVIDRITGFINPKQTIVRPVLASLVASNQVADHPVQKLFDGVTNSDWRADGKTPSVTATFPEKVDLLSVYVHPGVAGKDFVNFRRPSQLAVLVPRRDDEDGRPPGRPRQAAVRAQGRRDRHRDDQGPRDQRPGRRAGRDLRDRVLPEGNAARPHPS